MQANLLSFLNILLRYHYGCVIYGWDPVCEMDESWIQRMGVDQSPGGRNQPFYNVLGDDGSQRYAARSKLNFWLINIIFKKSWWNFYKMEGKNNV